MNELADLLQFLSQFTKSTVVRILVFAGLLFTLGLFATTIYLLLSSIE